MLNDNMNLNHQDLTPEQSAGDDPKSSKRNSGLFAFFKWFKPSASRESINSDVQNSHSSSCDSLTSLQSNGTAASFSFVSPNAYSNRTSEKCIAPGPETDTYKARLKQRDKRRENDKNITLRKKYNLFFHRDTLKVKKQDENTKSLPLMTKGGMEIEEEIIEKGHRRTNSESSKIKKAGSYLHVKGKRKAPAPPKAHSTPSTMSLKRKKRVAPLPPEKLAASIQKLNQREDSNKYYADVDVICNDSLKLDHGILKPAKETENKETLKPNSPMTSRMSYVEPSVSPRPWYKRTTSRESHHKKEKEHKYELIERLSENTILRNSTLDLTMEEARFDKKKEEKRKSGIAYLTNISELDREASEIIRKEHLKNGYDLQEIPEFMRPRDEVKMNTDSWVSPKRRSARDLIAKFNAITTHVSKVTVFGVKDSKRDYFGKQHSLDENKRQESMLESHKKRIEQIDKRIKEGDKFNVLMKSESASAIKTKPETPKLERKSWNCSKCNIENDYWRIICHVCSAIKPYFDDFAPSRQNEIKLNEVKTASPLEIRKNQPAKNSPERILERSKTQIGFSALASYNAQNKKKSILLDDKPKQENDKKEEREKLKKMLIEMKNSLPKRKSNILMKQNSRTSIIMENPENSETETKENSKEDKEIYIAREEKTQEQKVAEILIGTTTTIYENIKMKKNESPKPLKISSSAQTSAVVKQVLPVNSIANLIKSEENKNNTYELMRPKDFEDIYSDKNAKSTAKIYANLAQSDELSLFFNVPKKLNDLKQNLKLNDVNTDTIEINRLLKRLETAIAKGDLTEAAIFAKELAQLKVNCSVIRQKVNKMENAAKQKNGFQIEMYVEDKISHRGPFPIQVTENQTVSELKRQIEKEFEIPFDVQRWILGKELVTNENATLKDHDVTSEGCPVFLYLVAPDPKLNAEKRLSQALINEDRPSTSKESQIPKPTQLNENEKKSEIVKNETKPKIKTEELTKTKDDHTPKIVKVIPKIVDNIPKTEPKSEPKNLSSPVQQTSTKIEVGLIEPSDKKIENQSNIVNTKQKTTDDNSDITVPKKFKRIVAEKTIIVENNNNKMNVTVNRINDKIAPTKVIVTEIKAQIPKTVTVQNNITVSSSSNSKIEYPKVVKIEEDTKIDTKKLQSENLPSTSFTQNIDNAKYVQENKSKIVSINSFNQKLPGSSIPDRTNITKIPSPCSSNSILISLNVKEPQKASENLLQKPTKIEIPSNKVNMASSSGQAKEPQKATLEKDFEEYESKTLTRPVAEWECHLCTLLNPLTSNICAVCATVRLKTKKSTKTKKAPHPQQTYMQLVNLDNADLVENPEPFECLVCFAEVPTKEGVTLRECLHQFCKVCLAHTIEYTEEAEVKCPYIDKDYSCNIALQDREIKALVKPEIYDQFLARSVAQAENKMDKSFHCKTPDCKGWCIYEDNVNEFRCPVCKKTNCLTCQAIHMGANCKEYQERMNDNSEIDEDAKRTKFFLEEMVNKGEALTCPTCKVILMKKWGCDWLRCSMCKTEICWVTRGPRWGPAGKGDTSGGCQCGVNGVKCHPKCNYCH